MPMSMRLWGSDIHLVLDWMDGAQGRMYTSGLVLDRAHLSEGQRPGYYVYSKDEPQRSDHEGVVVVRDEHNPTAVREPRRRYVVR
jgi:hypothetical protein